MDPKCEALIPTCRNHMLQCGNKHQEVEPIVPVNPRNALSRTAQRQDKNPAFAVPLRLLGFFVLACGLWMLAPSLIASPLMAQAARKPADSDNVARAATPVLTGGAGARQFVEEKARILFSDPAMVPDGKALITLVDVPTVAKFTLGRYARTTSAADLQRYQKAAEQYMIRVVDGQIKTFAGSKLEVLSVIERNPQDVVVRTRITRRDREPVALAWRLLQRDQSWKIVDLETAGIWLAIQVQAESKSILDQSNGNINALIARYNGSKDGTLNKN